MTFPDIAGSVATTTIGSPTTSHAVNLPSGIANGDEVVLLFGTGADASTISATNWTELVGGTNALPGSVGTAWAAVRIADASWPNGATTVTVTTGNSVESAAICFRVEKHNSVAGANNASGTSASPDPTNFGPIASADYLIIAAYFADGADLQGSPTVPAGYTSIAQIKSGASATTSVTVGAAWKNVTGTDENPGAFTNTLTASQEWQAYTIAIAPSTNIIAKRAMLRGVTRGLNRGFR